MVRQAMDFVTAFDPELGRMIEAEYKRQARNIELIASENIVSEAVMAAMGSVLTNKYASMRWKTSPSAACASCSARNTRTCSRTRARRRTWRSIRRCASRVIPCSA